MNLLKKLMLTLITFYPFIGNAASVPSDCTWYANSTDNLKAPDYVLLNQSARYIAEANTIHILGGQARFHTEEDGFYAEDSFNLQGDASVHMTFNSNLGEQFVWVQFGYLSPTENCIYNKVNVQSYRPNAEVDVVNSGQTLFASIKNVTIDPLSKVNIEGDGVAKVSFRFEHEDYPHKESTVPSSSLSITYSPVYSGPYRVYAIVSDGYFHSTVNLGNVLFLGGQPCTTCGPIK